MFTNFSEEAQDVLIKSKKEMQELKHPYIGTEHFILSILNRNNNIKNILEKYSVTYEKFKQQVIKKLGINNKGSVLFLYTPLLKKVIENAILDSKENNDKEVTLEHLFIALLEQQDGIALRILTSMNIDLDKLYETFVSKKNNKCRSKKHKKLLVEELGVSLTKKALNKEIDPVIGRDKEIKRLLEILCRRTKNNPLLIGLAGVGKTAIVEELSRLIVTNNVPKNLLNKQIISLDMASAVAGTKYRGEFEEKMKKIIKEIEDNSNIILFIDEIHTLVGAGGAEGAIDASNILKPALARGKIRCIGATTIEEYTKFIEKDSALERRFQKIIVNAPNTEETKEILLKLKPIYESYHQVKIEDTILTKIVELSQKYIYDRNQPDKAIDILDEVCSKVSLKEPNNIKEINDINKKLKSIIANKNTYIIENKFDKAYNCRKKELELTSKLNELECQQIKRNIQQVELTDVAEVIYTKTSIPIYEILQDNLTTINSIKNILERNIIGQDKAIKSLINTTKKIKLGYKTKKTPYSILFAGPSGVGKTSISQIYASSIVGDDNIIKLDMSEYSDSSSLSRILGSSPGYIGYNDNKSILESIRNKPNSVIILDEIEKAHPKVINLFYQILDDGHVKDAKNNVIRFDNNIIIMTTNIGFERNNLGFTEKSHQEVVTSLKEHLKVSFINRINNIIVFDYLTEKEIVKITKNSLAKIIDKYNHINLTINKGVIKEIINMSNYQEFGARKINQIIENYLESIIIDNIIENNKDIKVDSITIPPNNEKITNL
ncbi:MAG: ATP-dependent Clp protease ATP-binding subunit [bacterium]|nr:ATP-dependent Clp protease ATP-binding subunit [bacterium]